MYVCGVVCVHIWRGWKGDGSHTSANGQTPSKVRQQLSLYKLSPRPPPMKLVWTSRPFNLWGVGQEEKKGLETLDTVLCSLQEFR